MTIHFQASSSPGRVDPAWIVLMKELVDIQDKLVLDIGCKEGLYTKALVELGARAVTGLELSREHLNTARANVQEEPRIDLVRGDPLNTGLLAERYDVVMERDILHQYPPEEIHRCLEEAYRLLKPGGLLIIQERMSDDRSLPGSKTHLHGYFFSRYPKLRTREFIRSANADSVKHILQILGYQHIQERKYWQIDETYPNLNSLAESLLSHNQQVLEQNLSDEDLESLATYITYLEEQMQQDDGAEIISKDRWTILCAVKASSNVDLESLTLITRQAKNLSEG
ncbi:MAG TPA: methyltransferase domain-containing protein [Ktedonobacteraceae bacterium]|nr:methyltransferase domain-containing protein [Ktedonobacteraceae bacterium]